MCGIICVLGDERPESGVLTHRGPDDIRNETLGKCYMEFTRLSINDTSSKGMQPFFSKEKTEMVTCNGEIYNHKDLYSDGESQSDCECIIPLMKKHDDMFEVAKKLRGVFAICYTDGEHVHAARDPIGVRPLFYTKTSTGIAFASEIKALTGMGSKIEIFPPGHVYNSKTDSFKCYYTCQWQFKSRNIDSCKLLKKEFIKSVQLRITNTDRPVAYLLSGGLDSSLVTAIGREYSINKTPTFAIGTSDSPDCKAAEIVSDYLKTKHTRVNFDITQGIRSLRDVIKSLETYDVTTIRASIPMWLLCKHISENTDYKVILSGEGSDEMFGGYLYFHGAPGQAEFFNENMRLLKSLHQYDVLRADRCAAAHGLELRVPFLDKEFIECVMGKIDQRVKCKKGVIEKWVLRKAFKGYLPDEILWRQKDAFSDAVGYSWIEELKEHAKYSVTDEEYEDIKLKSGNINVPVSKEEALYRKIFWELFGQDNDHLVSEIWRPRWTTETNDPSAKYLKQHGVS